MSWTAFVGPTQIASGARDEVVTALHADGRTAVVFDDATGRVVDVDVRGTLAEALGRVAPEPKVGRPKLGVVSREVSLLPRHWDWLAERPRSASATLRRLVDDAHRVDPATTKARNAAYAAMSTLAGDLPGFEEASRALFADDRVALLRHTATWPSDVQAYVLRLLGPYIPPGYIDPEREQVIAWLRTKPEGPVVMLNLLRFRDVADYSATPHLAPVEPISGEAAYRTYVDHTAPFLDEAGGRVRFLGRGGAPLIGPTDERWDEVLLVEHRSAEAFLAFAQNEPYLAGLGHRTAALEDARLFPLHVA